VSPPRKRDGVPSPYEKLSESDKSLLSNYFADPTPATSLVVIYPGKIRPAAPLVRFFSGLPSQTVRIQEVKRLRDRELASWVARRFASRLNTASAEAVRRMVDLVGPDLRALDAEVEKVSTYVGPKQKVNAEDVDAVSGWIRSYVEWELTEHLERADYRQCLLIMHKLLEQEGVAPLRILALVAGFFRDILLAKLRLQEGQKDRKAIFKEIKPQIRESYRGLYERQFHQLFSLVEEISWKDLQHILDRLRGLDLKIKSTGLAFRSLMEGFLFEYCWIRRYGRPIDRT
jgi:DNA polymerase-3 subunit delta